MKQKRRDVTCIKYLCIMVSISQVMPCLMADGPFRLYVLLRMPACVIVRAFCGVLYMSR